MKIRDEDEVIEASEDEILQQFAAARKELSSFDLLYERVVGQRGGTVVMSADIDGPHVAGTLGMVRTERRIRFAAPDSLRVDVTAEGQIVRSAVSSRGTWSWWDRALGDKSGLSLGGPVPPLLQPDLLRPDTILSGRHLGAWYLSEMCGRPVLVGTVELPAAQQRSGVPTTLTVALDEAVGIVLGARARVGAVVTKQISALSVLYDTTLDSGCFDAEHLWRPV